MPDDTLGDGEGTLSSDQLICVQNGMHGGLGSGDMHALLGERPPRTVRGMLLLAQGRAADGMPAPRPVSVGTELTVHHLSLLERARYYRAFISSLPLGTAASIVFWSALLNRRRAISLAMTCAPKKQDVVNDTDDDNNNNNNNNNVKLIMIILINVRPRT